MKILKILPIPSIVIIILGLALTFIPTEIGMTLFGVILIALGGMLLVIFIVQKGQ